MIAAIFEKTKFCKSTVPSMSKQGSQPCSGVLLSPHGTVIKHKRIYLLKTHHEVTVATTDTLLSTTIFSRLWNQWEKKLPIIPQPTPGQPNDSLVSPLHIPALALALQSPWRGAESRSHLLQLYYTQHPSGARIKARCPDNQAVLRSSLTGMWRFWPLFLVTHTGLTGVN